MSQEATWGVQERFNRLLLPLIVWTRTFVLFVLIRCGDRFGSRALRLRKTKVGACARVAVRIEANRKP
jgi:hypothetical protein